MLDNIMKEGFILYKSFYDPIKGLSKELKGDLFDALFLYQIEGVEPTQSSPIYTQFLFFRSKFLSDNAKYKETCNKNKTNALKRWEQQNAIAFGRMPPDAMYADRIDRIDRIDIFIKENLLDDELREKYFEFISYRKSKKKKVSFAAAQKHIKFLLSNPVEESIQSIENSIMNDWQGLFPIRNRKYLIQQSTKIDEIDHSK